VLVIQNQEIEPIGALRRGLVTSDVEVTTWEAWSQRTPPAIGDIDGLVVLGGAANPDDAGRLPWLAAELRVLDAALERDVPMLGVCLGAELIADRLGAETYQLPSPEIGWVQINQTAAARHDPLWKTSPEAAIVFEWHSYGFRLPPNADPLATGGASLQAFRWGRHVWGLQFHPDADQPAVDCWIGTYAEDLRRNGIDPAALAAKSRRAMPASEALATTIAGNFIAIVGGAAITE
jgi:GMP synthase-like glutamine amidotransferase